MVENICAIATPYGTGAISIIRCSGPDAIVLVERLFKGKKLTKVPSHTIHHGYILDQNQIVDEVLCNVFKQPTSFDGENAVEINCHGGVFVTRKILRLLLKNGFRLAEPGEFSKRAFLNGRLDLTQAEAIMDIISAENDWALQSAQSSLLKKTSHLIADLRNQLLDVLAKIEVNIDYPEYEDNPTITKKELLPHLLGLQKQMETILSASKISKLVIHGIQTALVGKPNVGKSSLLNLLLDEDKAIVSSVAGTTRDFVEGSLTIGNITLHLIDTAGIRQSKDEVERIGIKRSTQAIEQADLVLLVLDVSKPLEEEDYSLLEKTKSKKRILIANKCDLPPVWQMDDLVFLSAEKKTGLDALIEKIYEMTEMNTFSVEKDAYLSNDRQILLMEKAFLSLKQAIEATESGMDVDLIEIDVKSAFDALGEITGQTSPDELITALFTKFCLGK